jgi:pyruvate,orthophosphate dikinase
MLQCRIGKRNGPALNTHGRGYGKGKMIKKEQAVMRVTPPSWTNCFKSDYRPKTELGVKRMAKGLPAGPEASGQIVFSSNEAVEWAKSGKTGYTGTRRNKPRRR